MSQNLPLPKNPGYFETCSKFSLQYRWSKNSWWVNHRITNSAILISITLIGHRFIGFHPRKKESKNIDQQFVSAEFSIKCQVYQRGIHSINQAISSSFTAFHCFGHFLAAQRNHGSPFSYSFSMNRDNLAALVFVFQYSHSFGCFNLLPFVNREFFEISLILPAAWTCCF